MSGQLLAWMPEWMVVLFMGWGVVIFGEGRFEER